MILMSIMSSANTALAQPDVGAIELSSRLPYCGMNVVYAAGRLHRIDIYFEDLLRPQYFSDRRGSSLADVAEAARDNGMKAEIMSGLTIPDLRATRAPIILHVKNSAESADFDHYVLCLRADGTRIFILDPPKTVQAWSYPSLLTVWNGKGVLITDSADDAGYLRRRAHFRALAFGLSLLAAILSVHLLARFAGPFRHPVTPHGHVVRTLAGTFAIVSAAAIAGSAFHFLSPAGFFSENSATREMQEANFKSFLPRVSADDVARFLATDAVFVDARHETDFNSDHIQDALNIPPFSNEDECKRLLTGIPNHAHIIVYCQSAACPYAIEIAKHLSAAGYSNLSYFKGGWQAWSDRRDRFSGSKP